MNLEQLICNKAYAKKRKMRQLTHTLNFRTEKDILTRMVDDQLRDQQREVALVKLPNYHRFTEAVQIWIRYR